MRHQCPPGLRNGNIIVVIAARRRGDADAATHTHPVASRSAAPDCVLVPNQFAVPKCVRVCVLSDLARPDFWQLANWTTGRRNGPMRCGKTVASDWHRCARASVRVTGIHSHPVRVQLIREMCARSGLRAMCNVSQHAPAPPQRSRMNNAWIVDRDR